MIERVRWNCPGCAKVYAVPSTMGLTLCPACDPSSANATRSVVQPPDNHERLVASCPACNSELSAKPKHLGKRIQCPKCSNSFVFNSPTSGSSCVQNQPASAFTGVKDGARHLNDVERFAFSCPSCSVSLLVKTSSVGKTRKCPSCAEDFVIAHPTGEQPIPAWDRHRETLRYLHMLAVNGASLIQQAAESDWPVAMLTNNILVVLPSEEQASQVKLIRSPSIGHALKISKQVRRIIGKYGSRYAVKWTQSLAQVRIVVPDHVQKNLRRMKFEWRLSRKWSQGGGCSVSRRKWPIRVRIEVWERHGKSCYYCGGDLESWFGHYMHLDHKLALAQGGVDHESNLVPACPECNLEKGAKILPGTDVC